MTVEASFDVVVVGGGLAGLSTALACLHHELSVIVLEKTDLIGGATSWSYGAVWVGNNDQAAELGVTDDNRAVADYLHFLGGGENDPARTQALIDRAPQVLRLFRQAGISFDIMAGVNDVRHGEAPGTVPQGRTLEPRAIDGGRLGNWRARLRTPPGAEWRLQKSIVARIPGPVAVADALRTAAETDQVAQGAGLIASLLCVLLERGVEIRTGCEVTRLLVENARVSGVACRDGGQVLAARAVMLASGSYLSNMTLAGALEKLPGYRSWYPQTNTGDGLLLAAELGAAIGTTRNNVAIMLGFDDPADDSNASLGAPSVRELPRAHTMVVNRAGARFGNEAAFQDLSLGLRALDAARRTYRNLPCWFIFDHDYADRWGFAGSTPGAVPDWVARADSPAGLATALGIDPVGLCETAARMTHFAQTGVDEDFGRSPGWAMTPGGGGGRNASLGCIANGPFYGVELFPTVGVGSAGLKADRHARVLNWRGAELHGLYAAGDVAQHDELGIGYQAGLTYASAMVFPFLAAENIKRGYNGHA